MSRAADPPEDPDPVDTGRVSALPVHLRPAFLAAVAGGGLLGTPARYGLGQVWPARPGGWPTGTFLANLVGALLLGLLLEALVRGGDDTGARRLARLGLGTGLLGSFTTYSALAVETDLLARDGRALLAAGYALATVLGGLLLTGAGIALGAAGSRSGEAG